MLSIHIEKIGDLAIVECEGQIAKSDAAFKLRQAVMSEPGSAIIVIDLSEVHAIEDGGLGILSGLQRWAEEERIQLKFFNPSSSVRSRLEHNESVKFHIAPFQEMITLLRIAEGLHSRAA